MTADARWRPFNIADEQYGEPGRDGVRVLNLRLRGGGDGERDRAGVWLRNAMLALAVLAAGAAAVSYAAQYRLVYTAKHLTFAAAVEAGIPDVGAAVFACLGIALALHGKRALRARALNLVCVGLSVVMNALAAEPGWRDLAVWVMPSAVYAVASDTLIGVIRAWTIARHRGQGSALADEETTPLAVLAGVLLWGLRLLLAPRSTLGGFRCWVVTECPSAPQPRALTLANARADEVATSLAAARGELEAASVRAGQAEDRAGRALAERDALAGELDRARADRSAALAASEQAVAASNTVAARDRAAAERADQEAGRARAELAEARAELGRVQAAAGREVAGLRAELDRVREDAARERDLIHGHYRARLERLAEHQRPGRPRGDTKTARFLRAVEQRYGPLAGIDLGQVGPIAAEVAAEVDLNTGSARTALRAAVLRSHDEAAEAALKEAAL
jgi:hypothetical protein